MKELYIIRHAKSSWSFDLTDHDRPLGKRGRKDVHKMAAFVEDRVDRPEIIMTSSASRAFYTALFFADAWKYPEEEILVTSELYHADRKSIVNWLGQFAQNRIAIFGHNPGFTNLINDLSDPYLDNLPTTGMLGLQFSIKSWSDLKSAKGKRLFYHTPKTI